MEISSKICRWVNKLQEYDMDIQTTQLVRGLYLENMMKKSNLQVIEINEVKEGDMNVHERLENS